MSLGFPGIGGGGDTGGLGPSVPNTFTALQTFTGGIAGVAMGKSVFVDSVNGSDSTGAVHNFYRPFLTLGAAKTAASSGDTIVVYPGAYTPTANLAKNGVNWYFYPGTTVNATGTWGGGIFDDSIYGANGAVSFVVSGEGVFNYSPSDITAIDNNDFDSAGAVSLTNASSVVWFRASKIINGNGAAASSCCVFQANGQIFIDCDYAISTPTAGGYCLWWENGDFFARVKRCDLQFSATGGTCVRTNCTVGGTPSGKFWLLVDTLVSTGYCVWSSDSNTQAAVWINGHELNSTSNTPGNNQPTVFCDSTWAAKLYVSAQKIVQNVTGSDVIQLSSIGGNLWLNTNKLSSIANPFINMSNGGAGSGPNAWISVQNFESLATIATGISLAQGSLILTAPASTLTATTGLLQTGGVTNISGLKFDSSVGAGGWPINLSGSSSITCSIGNVNLLSNGSSDSIHATAAHTVTKIGTIFTNNAKNSNITISSPTTNPEFTAVGGIITSAAGVLSNNGGHTLATYAVGTVYTYTNSDAAIAFGTTSPSVTLDQAGTYILFARVNSKYVAATFAGNQTLTVHLQRTNNTPASITNATTALTTQIITALTYSVGDSVIPPTIYTTANTNDAIAIYGSLTATPGAGSVTATEAEIVAIRIY